MTILLIECEGLHGVARPLRMAVMYEFGLTTVDLTSLVDSIATSIMREVANVADTVATIQELTQDNEVAHATIAITYKGQETPSNELNIRFVGINEVNDWPVNKREARIVREIMDISKEFHK